VDPEGAVHSLVACMTPSPLKQLLTAETHAPVMTEGLQEVPPKGPAQVKCFVAQVETLATSQQSSSHEACEQTLALSPAR